MKILFNIHSLHVGGAETVVTEYLLALKKAGHDVVLVTDERKESFLQMRIDRSGIPTISLRPQNSFSLWGKAKRYIISRTMNYSRRWKQILEAEKPDVVHLHSRAWDLHFPGEQTVFTFHSEVPRSLEISGEKHRVNVQRLADAGASFFCLTERAEKDVRRIFSTERTVVIPNGVDLDAIYRNRCRRNQILQELKIPESTFVLGHVGRFHPVKNHPKLLEIFGEVVKMRPDSRLLLIGTGEESYMQKIREQAKQLNIADKVTFLGLREDTARLMCAFDAMAVPSFSESFSLTLVEAQALGVRCVASSAVPEEVICNANCFKLDLEEASKVWAELLLSKSERETTKDIGCFDLYAVTGRMAEAYSNLLPDRKAEDPI